MHMHAALGSPAGQGARMFDTIGGGSTHINWLTDAWREPDISL
jgi:hypothetical protein